jgi:putative copper resistance protein D
LVNLLSYARALHFAATILLVGIVFFAVFIAEPALREAPGGTKIAVVLRRRLAWIAWISLAFCVLSGAAWFVLTSASMSGQPLSEIYTQGVLGTVLSQTDFGNDWLLRLVFVCILALLLPLFLSPRESKSGWVRAAAVVLAAALVGSLAFAGHAIGDKGIAGIVHPIADILHLIAVAAWVGALVPLALLLSMTGEDAGVLAVARTATLRFSTLGIVSVATILCTGLVNSWYLVGSISAFTESEYGRLLLIKIALFAAMVGAASMNRLWLTPRLVQDADASAAQDARRQLRRNAAIEAALGATIIAIVAVLGMLPPGSHAHHHQAIERVIPAEAALRHDTGRWNARPPAYLHGIKFAKIRS